MTEALQRPPDAQARLEPGHAMLSVLGLWSAKTLLSAAELGVFAELADGPLGLAELRSRLGLHERSARDFLDALVAMGMLDRRGGRYSNTPATAPSPDRATPSSQLSGTLRQAGSRNYGTWEHLTEALRTGKPHDEIQQSGNVYSALQDDPARIATFRRTMTSLAMGSIQAMAEKFPWQRFRTVADVGCSEGPLLCHVAQCHPHLAGIGFDLQPVGPMFAGYVRSLGLAERLTFRAGDFFSDPLPAADVIVFGHVLHNWDLGTKRMLLDKAFQALPSGGAVIVYEAVIDDDRRANLFGLLMSLNMLIETKGGFDFTGAECRDWLATAGFGEISAEQLAAGESMVVGIKP